MLLNQGNLNIVFTAFNAAFNRGLGGAPDQWQRLATVVPSATSEEKYGWLGSLPGVREWLGDRVVHNASLHDYAIKNRDFESTIAVGRNSIEDDQFGVMAPLFQELGMSAGAHPNELVFSLLGSGFTELAYDGQPFFDTDHPVLDANGVEVSVANTDGGAGDPWFLVDDSRFLKPVIFQRRREFQLVRKDRAEDENVFSKKEFIYGVDGRSNTGFGFWQFAWGSKQTLDKTSYASARAAMQSFKRDYGKVLGVRPRLLVVPPALEEAGLTIVNSERDAAGATNVWHNTAELLVVPWLA